MSETESKYFAPPVVPAWPQTLVHRAPERRKSVLSVLQAWVAVRDLVLPHDAEDRTNAAVVAAVSDLVLARDLPSRETDDHK